MSEPADGRSDGSGTGTTKPKVPLPERSSVPGPPSTSRLP